MKRAIRFLATLALLVSSVGLTNAGPIVHTSDFIPDSSRDGFNGFESIPNDGVLFTGGVGPYVEGKIRVRQVGGDSGNDIWVTSNFWKGFQGKFGWFPSGGDRGFTELSLEGDVPFENVGFNYGKGSVGTTSIQYVLLNKGAVVLSGSADLTSDTNYLGFFGGGYDAILLSNGSSPPPTTSGRNAQGLAIDNIETNPEPSTIVLLAVAGASYAGYCGWRRRKRSATET